VRRIAAAAVVAASLGISPAAAQTPGDEGPGPEEALTQRIAVWRLDALGIEAELVGRLETLFRSELDRLAKNPLPSRRQMDAAVGKDKKLRDCTGEDKCLTTIGKKVGVDVMVTGSVAALGESYVLNIKAVDVASGKQLRRIASDPLRGSPDELIEAVRVAAYSLLAPEQLYGSVQVLSDAVGATVWLDDKEVGKTPLPGPIAKQTLGKHALRVEAEGYLPFSEEVDIRFQKSTRVLVRLAAEEPVEGGGGPTRLEVRDGPRPWYTSRWMYVGAGVAAIALGAVIGWQLGKDDVISCVGDMPDPRCE
jgi:hypothetical protein